MTTTRAHELERDAADWSGPGARPHLHRREVPARFPVGARLPPLVLTPAERARIAATYVTDGAAAALSCSVSVAALEWRCYFADLAQTLAWRSARSITEGGRGHPRTTVPAREELVAVIAAELERAEESRRRHGRRVLVALARNDPPPPGTAVAFIKHPHTEELAVWDLGVALDARAAPPREDWAIPDALELVRELRADNPSKSSPWIAAEAERLGVRRRDARAALALLDGRRP